jgi:hypothetical protein
VPRLAEVHVHVDQPRRHPASARVVDGRIGLDQLGSVDGSDATSSTSTSQRVAVPATGSTTVPFAMRSRPVMPVPLPLAHPDLGARVALGVLGLAAGDQQVEERHPHRDAVSSPGS